MKVYAMAWTQEDGTRVLNQLYTTDHIQRVLEDLERWGCTDISIHSIEEDE